MQGISAEHDRHVTTTMGDMDKKVFIASMPGVDKEDGVFAADRGTENDAQHVLNQAVIDYKHEASKRTHKTDDEALKYLIQTCKRQ